MTGVTQVSARKYNASMRTPDYTVFDEKIEGSRGGETPVLFSLRVLPGLLQVEGGPETLLADRVNGEPQGCDLVKSLAEPAEGFLVDVDPDARLLRHAHRSF